MTFRGKPFACGYDPRRHYLSRAEQRKGYDTLQRKIAAGLIPSRVAASIRKRLRRYYGQERRDRLVPVCLETWPQRENAL